MLMVVLINLPRNLFFNAQGENQDVLPSRLRILRAPEDIGLSGKP